jgi:hypothetical protein
LYKFVALEAPLWRLAEIEYFGTSGRTWISALCFCANKIVAYAAVHSGTLTETLRLLKSLEWTEAVVVAQVIGALL